MVKIRRRPPKPENRVEMNMRGQLEKARSGEARRCDVFYENQNVPKSRSQPSDMALRIEGRPEKEAKAERQKSAVIP